MLTASILIVDDDSDILETARMFLKQEFSTVHIEQDPTKIPGRMATYAYDVILLDMNFRAGLNDGEEGFRWLNEILRIDPQAVVILITAYGEIDLAVRAIKKGAVDFVLKPWKNQKLLGTIMAALQLRQSKMEIRDLKTAQEKLVDVMAKPDRDFIGESPAIQRVRELIDRVAGTDADVLILGENGTGKELVARAIHRNSLRKNKAFISVDLGSIAATLFETELFGHVKGAFTDARQDKAGRFELAAGGTIFLDEIGNLSPELQAKLLTVLQSRVLQRVGSTQTIPVDFRLISATNMPLNDMVVDKQFRQDLLYRINTVEIRVPPLRERTEDIPLLIDHFLARYSKKYKRQDIKVDKSLLTRLKNYHWPGNIRELQHAVERAVILNEGRVITAPELMMGPGGQKQRREDTPKTLEEMEKRFILQSLEDHAGNVTQTAITLGMTRTALYRRMKKHGI